MGRDYAKRPSRAKPRRKYKKRKKKSRVSWRLWLVTLLLIVFFVGFLLHLAHIKASNAETKLARVKAKRALIAKSKLKKLPVPQFDFYTILPKQKVKILAHKKKAQFYLQIASVKEYTAADRLKAELALLGFDVYIVKIDRPGKILYEVNVGPYLTKAGAKADRQQLLSNKIKSILRKEKITNRS